MVMLYFAYSRPSFAKAKKKAESDLANSGPVYSRLRFKLNEIRIWQRTWKILMLTIFLTYPSVCSQVFSFFFCREVAGGWYMSVDLTVPCYDATWNSYLPYVTMCLIVYPIGFPCVVFYKLFEHRRTLDSAEPKLKLGFLLDASIPSLWWGAICDRLYKVALTCIVGLVDSTIQLPVALSIVGIYLLLNLLATPFRRLSDDQLQLFCLIETLMFLFVGYMIFIMDNPYGLDDSTDLGLSLFLILISCMMMFGTALVGANGLVNFYMKRHTREDLSAWALDFVDTVTGLSNRFTNYLEHLDNKGKKVFSELDHMAAWKARLDEFNKASNDTITKNGTARLKRQNDKNKRRAARAAAKAFRMHLVQNNRIHRSKIAQALEEDVDKEESAYRFDINLLTSNGYNI
jgi:putative effector of murein hydrolase LrgA (UPF0299 family)